MCGQTHLLSRMSIRHTAGGRGCPAPYTMAHQPMCRSHRSRNYWGDRTRCSFQAHRGYRRSRHSDRCTERDCSCHSSSGTPRRVPDRDDMKSFRDRDGHPAPCSTRPRHCDGMSHVKLGFFKRPPDRTRAHVERILPHIIFVHY